MLPVMAQGCDRAHVRGAVLNVKLRFRVHETSPFNDPGSVMVAEQMQRIGATEAGKLQRHR